VRNNPWVTKSSRIAYENAWIRVREDQVIRPDGGAGIYGVIEIRPSVGVVAMDEGDQVVLVGQWRYSVNRYSWEVAKRELAEEAGVQAAQWEVLGPVDVCNGVADDVQTLFLATGLTATAMRLDPEEEIVVERRPFEEAVRMVMDGRITEVCSVAAILKVALLRSGN
jgi:8-oxo-dGTP pyrophosphatase MutT (NUDIX family)